MRTRYMSLTHYGITREEGRRLLNMAREQKNSDLVRIASRQSNSDLEDFLFISLTEGTSYELLFKKYFVCIGRDDFYGYRRRALCLFKMLLMCRDAGYLIEDIEVK